MDRSIERGLLVMVQLMSSPAWVVISAQRRKPTASLPAPEGKIVVEPVAALVQAIVDW